MPNYPAPTAIKEARGTARRDRANPAEPKPAELQLGSRPPTWIQGPRRRRAWTDLSELLRDQRLLTVLDAAALALLVDAYGDYLEASDLVTGKACGFCGQPVHSKRACTASAAVEILPDEEERAQRAGRIVVTLEHEGGARYYTTRTKEGSLMIRPHPAMAIRQDAWKRVVGLLREFGMTPSARTRVSAGEASDADPLDEFLRAGVA